MKILFLNFILFFYFGNKILSRNYSNYYRLVNSAEENYFNGKTQLAFQQFDKAFYNTNYTPFVANVYRASLLSIVAMDTNRFYKYISKCFDLGMPLTAIYASPNLHYIKNNTQAANKINNLFATRKTIKFAVDTITTETINKFKKLRIERDIKNDSITKQNYTKSELEFIKILDEKYFSKGIFPGEKYLGLKISKDGYYYLDKGLYLKDSIKKYELLTDRYDWFDICYKKILDYNENKIQNIEPIEQRNEYSLCNTMLVAIIYHNRCKTIELENKLWQCVLNGYLHPSTFALLHDESYFTTAYNDSITNCKNLITNNNCFYVYSSNKYPKEIEEKLGTEIGLQEVEQTRSKFYHRKYATELKMKKFAEDNNVKLFFGLLDSN
jgi:hypothetical protein